MIRKKNLILFMPSIEGGGVEKNLFIVSNYLSSKINNVVLITCNSEYRKFFKGIDFICPKSNLWKKKSRIYKYFICLILLTKILLRRNNCLVLAFQANFYCTILSKLFGANIIVRSNASPSGYSGTFLKKSLYKFIFSLADDIIVNSYDFKSQFKKTFSLNSTCIYNPLNFTEIIKKSKEKLIFPFFKKKKILKIINIARFTDQKDHLTFLKALKFLKNKIEFRAVIIGQGINRELIHNFIYDNGLQKNIKILNFQKNPYKYLKASDIFILTSKYEGLPNVLLEAATLKKFIISTNCPTGPREILMNGKAGGLVKMGDYKSISKIIMLFDKNRKKFNKNINLAFNSLNRFDYNINLKKYLNITKKYFRD